MGWATDGANRHDSILFEPTLNSAAQRGLLLDVETLHLDRAYASKAVRALCEAAGITDVICARKRPRGQANHTKQPTPLGMRWTVERTNSWLSNYGQLRRNTDRNPQHRLAQLALAITFIITIKLSSTGETAGTPPTNLSVDPLNLNPPIHVPKTNPDQGDLRDPPLTGSCSSSQDRTILTDSYRRRSGGICGFRLNLRSPGTSRRYRGPLPSTRRRG